MRAKHVAIRKSGVARLEFSSKRETGRSSWSRQPSGTDVGMLKPELQEFMCQMKRDPERSSNNVSIFMDQVGCKVRCKLVSTLVPKVLKRMKSFSPVMLVTWSIWAGLSGTMVIASAEQIDISSGQRQLTGGLSFAAGYPLDQVHGVTISGAYGVGALTSKWRSGPLFDLVANGITTTIHGVGPGYPDVKAIATAIGVSPLSGIGGGTISRFYDQSGNANDFVQPGTTAGTQPELWLINGNVTIGFSGGISAGNQFMSNEFIVNNHSLSLFAAVTPFATQPYGAANSVAGIFGTGTPGAARGADIRFFSSSTGTAGSGRATTAFAGIADSSSGPGQVISPYIGNQPQILTATANEAGTTGSQNNTTGTGSPLIAGTHNANLFGNLSAQFPYCGRVQALIVSSSVFSGVQLGTMKTSLASWANISLTVNRANKLNVVVDGASTDVGQGSDPTGGYGATGLGGYGYTEQLKDQLPGVSWHNFAVSGATITNRTLDYSSGLVQNSAFQPQSTTNILIAPSVSAYAELLVNGNNAKSAFAAFQKWLAAAKSVSWTRITVIAYPDAAIAGMAAYNTLLFANQASLGYDLIDGRKALQPLLNGPPYSAVDGHPTVMGSALYVSIIKPYLMQFL